MYVDDVRIQGLGVSQRRASAVRSIGAFDEFGNPAAGGERTRTRLESNAAMTTTV